MKNDAECTTSGKITRLYDSKNMLRSIKAAAAASGFKYRRWSLAVSSDGAVYAKVYLKNDANKSVGFVKVIFE